MRLHPLQLRYCPTLNVAAEAWFFPGDSAEAWAEELARCGLAGMDTRLFLVPRSIDDRTCAGVLAVPARVNSVLEPPIGIPCRGIAGRLFVPADAILHPAVADDEVLSLCAFPVSFFHPVFGLSAFDEESTLRVCDLLAPAQRLCRN